MGRFIRAVAFVSLVAIPGVGIAESSQSAITHVRILKLEALLALYQEDTGRFPTTEEGLRALLERPIDAEGWGGPYLDERQTLDSWGQPLRYQHPAQHGPGPYDLYSIGVDSRDDAGLHDDITSWSGVPEDAYRRSFGWELVVLAALGLGVLVGVAYVLVAAVRALRRRLSRRTP